MSLTNTVQFLLYNYIMMRSVIDNLATRIITYDSLYCVAIPFSILN